MEDPSAPSMGHIHAVIMMPFSRRLFQHRSKQEKRGEMSDVSS